MQHIINLFTAFAKVLSIAYIYLNMNNTRRTIEEAFDIQRGIEVAADDFFRQPFDVLTQARSEQERANQQKRGKWLVCSTCGEDLRILGGKSAVDYRKPGKNFHFAHLHNSKDCPIKTTSKYSRDAINRMRYRGIAEGQPHMELKAKLYQGLNMNAIYKGQVTNLQLEKVIRSLDEAEWRKPDINLKFRELRLAVELQLSTTWLDVIVGRQEFYRQEGIFILWVFNAFDYKDDSRKLAFSDIIYTNNYNSFIFDEEALEASFDQKDLVLKCYFQHHYAVNDQVKTKWEYQLVTLDQLIFNEKTFKVYYRDIETEKAAAVFAVKQYLQQQQKEIADRSRERNRLRTVRAGISDEHLAQQKIVRDLEADFLLIKKDLERNFQERDNHNRELLKLSSYVKDIAERLDTYWRGLPEPIEELADMLAKRSRQLNDAVKSVTERRSKCEALNNYYRKGRVKHVNGIEYHVLDRIKEWDYISKNASRLYAYRTDQEKNLFATPDIQALNSHKVMQMRYATQVEFLIDYAEEMAANSLAGIALNKEWADFTAKRESFNSYLPQVLESCLRNHYNAQISRLHVAAEHLQHLLNELEIAKVQQQSLADELFGKFIELDYLDYYDDEDHQ